MYIYRIKDFVKDKSATFILECAKIAHKYGCSFKELSTWNTDIPDNDTTITSKRYNEVQAAKALLA